MSVEAMLLDALVSPRTGLIRRVEPQPRGPEEPTPPWLSTAELAHFDFLRAPRRERLNAGKGRTEAESRLAAIGEAVERYSALHWDAARVRVSEAPPEAIRPIDCVLYSRAQYEAGHIAYCQWSADTPTSWIDAIELPSGRAIAVPAALVYLVWPLPRLEDHVAAVTSNGLAAGSDLDGAILGALQELVERDALMITWLNRLPAARIETPTRGCHAASIVAHYRRFGVEVRLYRLPTDQSANVVLAVADNPDGIEPARVVGMGCAERPSVAVDKAAFELCQARPSEAARFRTSDAARRLRRYEDVVELDDHPAFHALAANRAEFDFLDAGGGRVALDELPNPEGPDGTAAELARLVDGLRRSGARVAYTDVTAPDVRATGLRVVRAFATGLQPIHFGYHEARLGGRRLFEAPRDWGLRASAADEASLNPCPHPLA